MKYIVYQYLLDTTINGDEWLPYELLILKDGGFGARFDWSCDRENCRLKKKLTEKVVQRIYGSCIECGTTFYNFDYAEAPPNSFMDDVKELFSLSTREKRIQKLQSLDELWGEKKLIYYQEI